MFPAVEMRNASCFCRAVENNKVSNYKLRFLNQIMSDKAFKGTVVNRTLSSLHEGSLEITLTVSLSLDSHILIYQEELK